MSSTVLERAIWGDHVNGPFHPTMAQLGCLFYSLLCSRKKMYMQQKLDFGAAQFEVTLASPTRQRTQGQWDTLPPTFCLPGNYIRAKGRRFWPLPFTRQSRSHCREPLSPFPARRNIHEIFETRDGRRFGADPFSPGMIASLATPDRNAVIKTAFSCFSISCSHFKNPLTRNVPCKMCIFPRNSKYFLGEIACLGCTLK